jgi:hypothetical protein
MKSTFSLLLIYRERERERNEKSTYAVDIKEKQCRNFVG